MQLVCVREGRQGFHVGDTVEVSDETTAIDLTYFSHSDSDASQRALAEKREANKPPTPPADNPPPAPEASENADETKKEGAE